MKYADEHTIKTLVDEIKGRFATKEEIPDVSGKADKTQLTNGSVTKVGTATVGDSANPIYLNSGTPAAVSSLNTRLLSGIIPIHPEGEAVVLPYITNDLAFIRQRGGSCKVYWGIYDSSKDYKIDDNVTSLYLYNEGASTDYLFDASPAYYTINPTGGCTPDKVIIIDIVMPTSLAWSNKFYISFGSPGWGFRTVQFFAKYVAGGYNDEFESVYKTTTNTSATVGGSLGAHNPKLTDGTKSSTPSINRLRILLTNSRNTSGSSSGTRIAQIGLVNYGSQGTRFTTMSRGIDDGIYRSITPAKNKTYNLGSTSFFWNKVYSDGFIKSGGTSSQFLKADGSVDSTSYQTKISSTNKVAASNVSGLATVATSGMYSDLSKPSGGIPKTDLATAVQTSLDKADTALQTHQDISGKQDVISDLATIRSGAGKGATAVQPSAISDMETKTHAASTYQPKGNYLTEHQDISGKADLASPTFTGVPKAPTAVSATSTTQIATTQFVQQEIDRRANDFHFTVATGSIVIERVESVTSIL